MSSPSVRSILLAEIERLVSPMPVYNLSDYHSISDLPINTTEQCLAVDFVAASDLMTTIGGSGNQGWEEDGTVAMHWLAPTGFESDPILEAAEQVRLALRGRRLSTNIVIESVEPFMDSGSPVDINGPWTGFSSVLFYVRHDCG